MKVIYHIPIEEKLSEAITKASDYGKKIDSFVLSEDEYNELMRTRPSHLSVNTQLSTVKYYGIRVLTEDAYRKENELNF